MTTGFSGASQMFGLHADGPGFPIVPNRRTHPSSLPAMTLRRQRRRLTVTCRLDHRQYPVGRRCTDEEFAHVNLKPNQFHGEWNYTIHPRD